MIIEYVQNAKWFDSTHDILDCEVKFVEEDNVIPFTVSRNEKTQKRKDIWDAALLLTIEDHDEIVIDMAQVKQNAKTRIDAHAGLTRQRFITVAAGQEMTYQEKADEAADFVAASYPVDTSSYPFIQAEMDATGKTKEQAADDILTQRAAWIAVGALIEKFRLSGKVQIDAATDENDVETILQNTRSLLDGI